MMGLGGFGLLVNFHSTFRNTVGFVLSLVVESYVLKLMWIDLVLSGDEVKHFKSSAEYWFLDVKWRFSHNADMALWISRMYAIVALRFMSNYFLFFWKKGVFVVARKRGFFVGGQTQVSPHWF